MVKYKNIKDFINWCVCLGRHWNQFEEASRNFAISRELDLVAYTGTSGVLELEHVNGDMVPIYLYNGQQLPVPTFYWRILHDTLNQKGRTRI